MATTTVTPRTAPLSNQDRFFRFFQHEVTALQERMQLLESHGTSGGERSDAVDFCLTSISKLTSEVKDASSYLPAYDQRTYGEAIKALTEKLQKIRASFAPRQKFSFKAGFPRKNASAISITDAAELAANQRLSAPNVSSGESSFAPTPLGSPAPERAFDNPTDGQASTATNGDSITTVNGVSGVSATLRKPSFSKADSITMSNHTGLHIILPSTAAHATASGTLSNLSSCIVDMTLATSTSRPFAALYLKNIKNSLIICGHVDGAAHITGLKNCVVVIASRQFRMHESKGCKLYLYCRSHPIIEDCDELSFAPLPATYMSEEDKTFPNQFDQVDDFKWLKAEASPNWNVMGEDQRIREEVWRDVVPGRPGLGPADILEAVGVL